MKKTYLQREGLMSIDIERLFVSQYIDSIHAVLQKWILWYRESHPPNMFQTDICCTHSLGNDQTMCFTGKFNNWPEYFVIDILEFLHQEVITNFNKIQVIVITTLSFFYTTKPQIKILTYTFSLTISLKDNVFGLYEVYSVYRLKRGLQGKKDHFS